MNVLVYAGDGVSSQSLRQTLDSLRRAVGGRYDIKTVDHRVLSSEPWEHQCAALVMPGGRDLPYLERLGAPIIIRRMTGWIGAGGRYLGICAGAYFASTRVQFEPDTPEMAVVGERPLRLLPVIAKGTLFPGTYVYDSEAGAKAIPVKCCNDGRRLVNVYYNGGCWFEDEESISTSKAVSSARICGTYPDGRAAIVAGSFGAGRVVLSGVHLEYDPKGCLNGGTPKDIVESIMATEKERWMAWLHLLHDELGLELNPNNNNNNNYHRECDQNDYIRDELTLFSGRGGSFKDSLIVGRNNNDEKKQCIVHMAATSPLKPPRSSWSFDPELMLAKLSSKWMGQTILYAEHLSSTQTLLQENPTLSRSLPNGSIVMAGHQLAGRGRGRNGWLSSNGCLQFSMILRHRDPTNLTLIQYLVAVSMVEAIDQLCRESSAETLPIRLKWPNDLLAECRDGSSGGQIGLRKIGGILVTSESSVNSSEFQLIIGLGFNVSNTPWSVSLADLVAEKDGQSPSQSSSIWSKESILATYLATFERLYERMNGSGGFPFDLYYKHWLHKDQIVFLETDQIKAQILGIDKNGYLMAKPLPAVGFLHSSDGSSQNRHAQPILLQPDGNSFDMMRNLIHVKK